MRTARLLSFLSGIRKLIGAQGRLRMGSRALKESRGHPGGFSPAILESVRTEADEIVGPKRLDDFCPKNASYIVSPKVGAAYLQIPKAACSSIMARILAAERPEAYATLIEADTLKNPFLLHHTKDLFCRSGSAEGLLRFTFVRHPFDRLLSFYANQVNRQGESSPEGRAARAAELTRTGFAPGMPFGEYIHRILDDPVARNNPHVRPQSEFVLGPAGLNIDFIGRVENLRRDWARLDAALDGKLDDIGHLNDGGQNSWRSSPYLDRGMIDRLAAHYRYDLWLFGYGID